MTAGRNGRSRSNAASRSTKCAAQSGRLSYLRAAMRVGLLGWSFALFAACAPGPNARESRGSATPRPTVATPSPISIPAPDVDLLRAMAQTRGFRLGVPTHAADGKAVLFLRSGPRDPTQSLFEMDIDTGRLRELVSPRALVPGPETMSPEERVRRERMRVRTTGLISLELSNDGRKALVTLSGRAFVVDAKDGTSREVSPGPGGDHRPSLVTRQHACRLRAWRRRVFDRSSKREGGTCDPRRQRANHPRARRVHCLCSAPLRERLISMEIS